MDEQRQQAYLTLINTLLTCPSGEEGQILQDNAELVDAGLVETMAQVAEVLAERGDENAAQFLIVMANQLGELLGLSASTATPEAQLRFLMQVLKATDESQGDPQVVYPLLQENLHLLDDKFTRILYDWGTATLADMEAKESKSIALIIGEFSNLIQQFPLGSQANNMEIAIAGYEMALTIFTCDNDSETWAILQNNLGNAYRDRIWGEGTENIERAIVSYQAALKVRTRTAFPSDWAMTQNNFGNAYWKRIKGEAAENIEIAIASYQAALQIYTREAFPSYWADTQNNLGAAYCKRIRGEAAENIELAIASYQAALEVYTRETFPTAWAEIHNNLGNAYKDRIRGDKAENIEIAIASYQAALEVRSHQAFPSQWAMTQNNLGIAYSDRIRGETAENIEIAIASYQAALQVRTREAFPKDWAETQNNLGNAYKNRIRGERAENIERAIASFQAALEVSTRDAFPTNWAMTQNNLGLAYSDRIRGEAAENIESAITSYQAALQVYTREAFPTNWAMTQNNLGIAYSNRIRGETAENIESALASYQAALGVYTREAFPNQWATTQNQLGIAYLKRIRGERAENIESAISSFQAALQVRARGAFPSDWAMTQNNLGEAYRNRIRGERAENIESAIASFQAALEIRTRESFPKDWAETQNNLGNAYNDRIQGDGAENLELAITSYQAALEVYSREAFPRDWAMTQNNLGLAHCKRIRGKTAENIESAIASYQAALKVYTHDAFPSQWAGTQNNLGIAYRNRIQGERAENIESAIASYQAALEIRTREAFPQNHVETQFNLGLAYRDAQQLDNAYHAFAAAIDTVEFQRVEISLGTANDADKQKLAEEWNALYRNMIEICLELADNTQAWEYIERSKTRNLLERLATRNLYPKGKIPEVERHQLQQLRQEIEVEQRRLAADTKPNYTHLNQLRQQYNQLFPFEPIRFNQIPTLLDNQTAMIQWYIFDDCFRAFIITRNNPQPIIWKSSAEDLKKLTKWTNAYLRLYYRKNSLWWQHQLESRLEKLAEILHIDHILSHIPETCNQLILVPHLYLHLLPIHALPVNPETPFLKSPTTPYLLDCFPKGVRYAPSCQLLQQTSHRRQFQDFFAIQNPRRDDPERNLVCADMEVEAIRKQFSSYQILAGSDAKKSALLIKDENTQDIKVWEKLSLAHCLYFSCHGRFNRQSPLDSCLELADSTLTLAEILEHFNLNQCRLVTLSACETGMVDFRRSDEYIGLPNGLLVAGSPSVVSSLWSVNQLSTALLMIKFYEKLAKPGNTITIALNEAQRWLRDTTVFGFLDWVKQSKQLSRKWRVSLREHLSTMETEQGGNATPYKSPDHWAAFCAIGQGV